MSVSSRSTVTNGAIDLAVFTSGNADGPPLVLVHGWPDTHALWNRVIEQLGDRYRIVTYDTRGAGESSAPKRTQEYALEGLAADFYAVIDAVSPGRPVHVLGHDWGGVEVWEAAAEQRASERIASYTSLSAPNLDHLAAWMRARLRRSRPADVAQVFAQLRASWYAVTLQLPLVGSWRIHRELRRGWAKFLNEFSDVDPSVVEVAPTLLSDALNGTRRYRANTFARMFQPPRERRVHVPVQLIVNTKDAAVLPYHYDDTPLWVDDLRRTELAAGHWSPLSHPREIATLTARFIDSIEERSKAARLHPPDGSAGARDHE